MLSTITPVDEYGIQKGITSASHVDEALSDFFGLPSNPLSIYHTGPAWPLPVGPQAQRVPKEARPVCVHEISSVWHKLGQKIYTYFDSIQLKWTSIDPVRFAKVGKEPGPLFLWVGVLPGTLTGDHAKASAVGCKEILSEYGIPEVEIAFRESVYTRYTGAKLFNYSTVNPVVDVHIPFTPALGLPIASKAFPYLEGTGCLYLCEGGDSHRVFLLTARHVVLPPSKYPNELYYRKNNRMRMPRLEIIHIGSRAFQKALEAIMDKTKYWDFMIESYKEELTDLGEQVEGENPKTTSNRKAIMLKLEGAKVSKASVSEFYDNITSIWSAESQRILGHVFYSPPISVWAGDSMFTEDWALVEVERDKFNWETFRGNVIYIGSEFTPYQFMKNMYPDAKTRAKFKYPRGGLMQLRDFVRRDELLNPVLLDENGEECLIVVKNGAATGVRLGRASGIESFVREYKDYDIHTTSREIAVYSYSAEHKAFSAPGDSGSVVGDANHRIVGMLTGGAGKVDATDVSYVSSYSSLNDSIKNVFPNSYLFPICKSMSA